MPDDKELIAGTIEDLRQSLELLRSRMKDLASEIQAKEARLAAWEGRLKQLQGFHPGTGDRKVRRPKGANLRAIANYLATKIEGETAAKIREDTGLAWSSVQRVLDKNKDIFAEADGLWRLTPTAAKRFGKGTFLANGTAHAKEDLMEEETT